MKKHTSRFLLFFLFLLALAAGGAAYGVYHIFLESNVTTPSGKTAYLYLASGATYEQLTDSLAKYGYLKHPRTFHYAALREKLADNVHPGRYALKQGMSNKALSRKLAMGWQDPINLTLSGRIRTYERLAALLSRKIEADSLMVLQALKNEKQMQVWGFDKETFFGMFIPNTYQIYWNISPEELMERMHKEYLAFWNEERQAKANQMGLSHNKVSTLASIVGEETTKVDEMPTVAGVYMNRLNKGMPLQADPTIIFALQDFSIRRVLNRHTKVDSPYNTYENTGLPPGPIGVPPLQAIDAVLNYKHHNYLYFCAKEDFSGYHNFATNLSEHNKNARKYHKALNAQ